MQSTYEIHCCNCLEFMKTLPDKRIDCIVTDPPYGLADKWTGGTWFTKNVYATDKVNWDDHAPQKIIDQLIHFDKPTVIWGGNNFILPISRCWLVWNKTNCMPTMADVELAWTNLDRPAKLYAAARNGWKRAHPTEKPIGLMRWVIDIISKQNDIIFDPFMGSGTTGVACMQLGRNFIGCEIDQGYFTIAERRIKAAQAQGRLELEISDEQNIDRQEELSF